MKEMIFTKESYEEIKKTVGQMKSETGGILLGNRDDFVVQKFIFDKSGSTTSSSYDPDIASLNKKIKHEWEVNKLALIGFVHSHPRGISRLSGDWGNGIGDIGYIKTIFNAIEALDNFLVPIIHSSYDGEEYNIFPYISSRGDEENYKEVPIKIIDNYPIKAKKEPIEKKDSTENLKQVGSIDVSLMKSSHILCIGIGGASGICEDLVRTGIGRLTAIDFDIVDKSNITTQGFTLTDVGKLKIDALGKQILSINPKCEYKGIKKDFLKISEEELSNIIKDVDLILFMTDDFNAQKRGNLVSLKYKKPAIFAIMYEKARAGEITFNIPGITPACHRCATSERYKAYNKGYENDITSSSSTVFQTHYFNSTIGMIALAILHNDSADVEFSNWFGKTWNKNLVQIRLNNKYSEMFSNNVSLFERTFSSEDARRRTFTFDSIWQTIEPERPPKYDYCPDCGGMGDLNNVQIGKTIEKIDQLGNVQ